MAGGGGPRESDRMDQIWNDLFVSGVPLLEKVLRTVLVYVAIVVLLRLIGKRNLAQLNTFDLVVVLLLSNVVQNAIIGPDDSLLVGSWVLPCCWASTQASCACLHRTRPWVAGSTASRQ